MARLIPGKEEETSAARRGCSAIFVNGVEHTNSAAKFWTGIIDDIKEQFKDCDTIELTAPSGEQLSRRHLYPQIAFAESVEQLLTADFAEVMKSTITELEMFGPPASVHLRVLAGDNELLNTDLPSDCVDEEIFSCPPVGGQRKFPHSS